MGIEKRLTTLKLTSLKNVRTEYRVGDKPTFSAGGRPNYRPSTYARQVRIERKAQFYYDPNYFENECA